MFLALTLLAVGLAWMLNSLGTLNDQAFGLIGSAVLSFAGILKIMNLKKGRKADDHF